MREVDLNTLASTFHQLMNGEAPIVPLDDAKRNEIIIMAQSFIEAYANSSSHSVVEAVDLVISGRVVEQNESDDPTANWLATKHSVARYIAATLTNHTDDAGMAISFYQKANEFKPCDWDTLENLGIICADEARFQAGILRSPAKMQKYEVEAAALLDSSKSLYTMAGSAFDVAFKSMQAIPKSYDDNDNDKIITYRMKLISRNLAAIDRALKELSTYSPHTYMHGAKIESPFAPFNEKANNATGGNWSDVTYMHKRKNLAPQSVLLAA